MLDFDSFLSPQARCYGEVSPKNFALNANLQEFSQRVGYICNLETAGKLLPEAAYEQIERLWAQLKTSHPN